MQESLFYNRLMDTYHALPAELQEHLFYCADEITQFVLVRVCQIYQAAANRIPRFAATLKGATFVALCACAGFDRLVAWALQEGAPVDVWALANAAERVCCFSHGALMPFLASGRSLCRPPSALSTLIKLHIGI